MVDGQVLGLVTFLLMNVGFVETKLDLKVFNLALCPENVWVCGLAACNRAV